MREKQFDFVISPEDSPLISNLKDLGRYKDLVQMFVKRDFISLYKQTILGPIWFFIQPVLTSLIMTLVFGRIAGISTDGVPGFLFYLSGVVFWNYFADCLTKTSTTFIDNQNIFGKVYFPRLAVPISVVLSNLLKLGVQLLLFAVMWCYYKWNGASIQLTPYAFLFPIIVLVSASLGLSIGLIITSLTTKYRDLRFLIQFGVQLAMYASPVVYPLSSVDEELRFWLVLNPMTSLIEAFKVGFTGNGIFDWSYLLYSIAVTLVLLVFGVRSFNKVERNFMDSI